MGLKLSSLPGGADKHCVADDGVPLICILLSCHPCSTFEGGRARKSLVTKALNCVYTEHISDLFFIHLSHICLTEESLIG